MTNNYQPPTNNLQAIITTALAEDIGKGDVTSELLIPAGAQAEMLLVAREPMVACGTFIPEAVYAQLDKAIASTALVKEGTRIAAGTALVKLSGPARAMLTGERLTLNLMQRMCGVATLTAQYVEAVQGTKAVIIDTRKTMPGLRLLDKYAVTCGGGKNHRMRLDDMVLVKDNHLGVRDLGFGIGGVIAEARKKLSTLIPNPHSPIPIVVECDTLEQVREALAAKPDRIMLDNMNLEMLKQAVQLVAGNVPLEATGGVSLQTVRAIAETGVDYISVGKLTHSAPSMDIGADIVIKSL